MADSIPVPDEPPADPVVPDVPPPPPPHSPLVVEALPLLVRSDTVLATFGEPLRVVARRDGAPVAGVEVEWWAPGGSLASVRTTTDSEGIASNVATLGREAGAYGYLAFPSGAARPGPGCPTASPATCLVLNGRPGTPVDLEIAGGANQVALKGVSFQPYVVVLRDAHGNATDEELVQWSVVSGGGMVTSVPYAAYGIPVHAAVATPQAAGDHVVKAMIPFDALTFTSVGVDALVLINSDPIYCGEGYRPARLTVSSGSIVGWRGTEGLNCWGDPDDAQRTHNVTFEDGTTSPTMPPGSGYARRFTAPGTYRYRCMFHTSGYDVANGLEAGVVTVLP
jgi:plastocyanin